MNFTNTTPNKTNDNVAPGRGCVCHRPVDCRQCDRTVATAYRPRSDSGAAVLSTRARQTRGRSKNYVVRSDARWH